MLEIKPVEENEVMLAIYMFNNAFATQTIRENRQLQELFKKERPERNAGVVKDYYDGNLEIYGLYEDTVMIGTVILHDDLVRHLAVDSQHQHQGYGEMLLKYVIDKAKEKGLKTLKVEAVGRNAPFYEKCGFKVVSDMEFTRYPHVKMECDLTK